MFHYPDSFSNFFWTYLPPYNIQTSTNFAKLYIFVSFQQITPKLGIFTDYGQDFLSSRAEGLSLTAGHIKSWKTVEGFIYPVVLLAGVEIAWTCTEKFLE